MTVRLPTAGPRPADQPANAGISTTTRTGTSRRPSAPDRSRARRLSPGLRKWIVAAHVLIGVGWFGITLAKLVLEIVAATHGDQNVARAGYVYAAAFDRAVFPPAAIATLVTGIVLSVGTAWGLFRHWWIVVKLALTIGVIVTGVVFVGAWTEAALATASDIGQDSTSQWLIGAAVAHALMLGAATVISVLKPWGRIGQNSATSRLQVGDDA
jgi:hypothetical protein